MPRLHRLAIACLAVGYALALSAGVTIYTALVSLLTSRKVRNDLAMTGEITLRGAVLPVGGIKEKVLAAKQAGIAHIVLPDRNRPDVQEIPEKIRKGVMFHFVKEIDEALDLALLPAKPGRKKAAKG